jgi:hypothetical protein
MEATAQTGRAAPGHASSSPGTAPAGARAALACAAIAAAITAAAGVVTVLVARTYLARTTYYYDSAQYRQVAALASRTLEAEGLGAALAEAAAQKDGLDAALRVLLWPAMLRNRFGHLAVALPFLAGFVFLVAWYVLRRTRSRALAALTPAVLLSAGLVSGPYVGLGDAWKDVVGCWLLGSAAVAWLLSGRLRSAPWAAAAGTCLGLLLLQRTVAAVFAAPAFAVLFVHAVVERLRADGRRRAWLGAAAFAAPAALLLAALAGLQWRSLIAYYSGAGYGYGSVRFVALTLAANAWASSKSASGAKKPTSTCPDLKRRTSSCIGGATFTTTSDSA